MDREAGKKTELVLCCGDFQAVRNPVDLQSLSVPPKYYEMGDFYRYYSEEVTAPILTIFVGGNHEASNYLQELPYGGWVAPNIWYMGYAGVVQFAGLRISGLSGIYKLHDYCLGHFEHPPYNEATKRSVYHLRNLEVFRLGQISRRLDIMLSHDWPRGIYHYGDTQHLLLRKRHFKAEVEANTLGSPPAEQLLCRLRPRFWFAAHLHCKFAAIVQHRNPPDRRTKFLALDKCLPSRDYLQFLDIEPDPSPAAFDTEGNVVGKDPKEGPIIVTNMASEGKGADEEGGEDAKGKLFIDPEWLCILHSTNQFLSLTQIPCMLPGQDGKPIRSYSATTDDLKSVYETFAGIFSLPHNFERTAPIYKPDDMSLRRNDNKKLAELAEIDARIQKQAFFSNPQTELLCAMLEVTNLNAALMGKESYNLSEMTSRIMTNTEEEDDDDGATGSEEDGFGPSPSKFSRMIPNPEVVNLGEKYEHEPGSVGGVYGSGTSETPMNENEYNPEPVVKNPEVIDIDGLDDDAEEEEAEGNEEPEAYEPYSVAGCEIDPEAAYNPQPMSSKELDVEGSKPKQDI
ncbi:Lariat debranching enzyme [Taenia solium]|eukprot:TsM_001227600 transcript=TsM_001227600 gene=TsM_001227600